MKFTTPGGSFELSIMGYNKANANWRERNKLQCRVSTVWQQQTDTQSAPLQTWEVGRLLNGLRSLWSEAARHVVLTFAEPGLSVEATALADNKYRLLIQLDRTLRPAWHAYPDVPVELTMQLSRSQLQQAIQDLTGELAGYPER